MPREPLDETEKRVLEYLAGHVRGHGGGPTLQALADKFEWDSTRAAGYRLEQLERKGYIERLPDAKGKKRGWQRVRIIPPEAPPPEKGQRVARPSKDTWKDLRVPDRGLVSCGPGVEVDEDFEREPLNVTDLFRCRDDLVSYVARGDSMIDAHIAPGDRLFVRPNERPPLGSIVVCVMGRNMYCKKLAKREFYRVVLKPCNGEAAVYDFDPNAVYFRVLGVLHSVLRTY